MAVHILSVLELSCLISLHSIIKDSGSGESWQECDGVQNLRQASEKNEHNAEKSRQRARKCRQNQSGE